MSDGQGGIGGTMPPAMDKLNGADEDTGRTVPWYDDDPASLDDGGVLAEAMRTIEASNSIIREAIEGLAGRIGDGDALVNQLLGQVARIESVLPQYNQAIAQLDARINALAGAVMRNNRYAALDLATKSRGPGEQAASVIKNAESYARFIEPEEPVEPEGETTGETQH